MLVEIWSDVVCPWCYLGKAHLQQALSTFAHADDVEIRYRAFELDATAVSDGTPTVDLLARKYRMTPEATAQAQHDMTQRAAAAGLTFHLDGQVSGNTRDAHRLLQWAVADAGPGRQAELADALYRAYFTEQRSVFDHDSLVAIAAEQGFDADEARAVLAGDDYADAVLTEEQTARDIGVQGVPFFVFDRTFAVAGAQPAEVLLAALTQAHDAGQCH